MSASGVALLVIDLQIGMLDGVKFPPLEGHAPLMANVRALLAWARGGGAEVAFVRHAGPTGEALALDAPGWPLHPDLEAGAAEPVFDKTVADAFSNPALEAWLRARGIQRLIVAGAQTDECVNATVNGARAAGLSVTVAGDAHGTWSWGGQTAEAIVSRHNDLFVAAGAAVSRTADIVGASTP